MMSTTFFSSSITCGLGETKVANRFKRGRSSKEKRRRRNHRHHDQMKEEEE
jgi:hypothetical protein